MCCPTQASPSPRTWDYILFWDASALLSLEAPPFIPWEQSPWGLAGFSSQAPPPPAAATSLAGAVTSRGSQTEPPSARRAGGSYCPSPPSFLTSSPPHLAPGASWPLQPRAGCQ